MNKNSKKYDTRKRRERERDREAEREKERERETERERQTERERECTRKKENAKKAPPSVFFLICKKIDRHVLAYSDLNKYGQKMNSTYRSSIFIDRFSFHVSKIRS